jgi:membrane-bound lytic murein transglycosylase D
MLKTKLTLSLCSSFLVALKPSHIGSRELPTPVCYNFEKEMPAPPAASKAPLNKLARQFITSYIKNSSQDLTAIKHRSTIPFVIIDSVFNVYGLPVELKYLAVIESELKPSALSRVGALGPWQLMPGTAHILGLKTNLRYDERKSYYKSTRAAAIYLKDLYAEFGDWLLVIAAYNCGSAPVHKAIVKSGGRNFWNLQKYLPKETSQHVKKFIATHYYFEGQGSLATLTKAEAERYNKPIKELATSSKPKDVPQPEIPKKLNESAEEKFKRLMNASSESLSKSNQLLEDKRRDLNQSQRNNL